MVPLRDVLVHLGHKTPASFVVVYKELIGPIPVELVQTALAEDLSTSIQNLPVPVLTEKATQIEKTKEKKCQSAEDSSPKRI